MYSEQTLEQFHPIFHRAVAFRLMTGKFDWDGANLEAPHHILFDLQDGWLVICFDHNAPTTSEATNVERHRDQSLFARRPMHA